MTPSASALLKSAEVAELLRVHPKQIYRLLARGLPGRRVGGEWRFDRDEVLRWAGAGASSGSGGESGAVATPAPTASVEAAGPPPLVAANGDVVIEVLLAHANAAASGGSSGALLGFVQADSGGALRLLAEERVLAAGCHGDGPPPRVSERRLARLHLVDREVGLAWRAGAPAVTVARLPRLRVAARPASAGVMLHLRHALAKSGVKLGKHAVLASHREVVCAVARGECDAGIVTRAWAERVGLAFRAIATEPYGLAVFAERLGHPLVTRLCEVAQTAAFRQALADVPGYDTAATGDIRYDPENT